MYEILNTGKYRRRPRLVSTVPITPEMFDEICQAQNREQSFKARKRGYGAAYRSTVRQEVTTRWEGELTTNVAEPGDWIVTRLASPTRLARDPDGNINRYVVTSANFQRLNERAKVLEILDPEIDPGRAVPVFQGKQTVDALYFAGGLDIVPPWGNRQAFENGAYLLLNGEEVYGNAKESFAKDYERLD